MVHSRFYISLVLLICFLFSLDSCVKDNIDPEIIEVEICKHRYTSLVEVFDIPPDNYDNFSGPDLRVDLKRSAGNDWEFSTGTIKNWSEKESVQLSFMGEIYLTNESWIIRLMDEDSPDEDDEICQSTFNPTKIGKDGRIDLVKDGVTILRLYYDEREE